MGIPAGTHHLGPGDGTLSLRTGRTGAVAKAGHDLLIHVTAWEATVTAGDDPAETTISLDADGDSLRVIEGTGGMKALTDEDIGGIHQTIAAEVLKGHHASFRSTRAEATDGGLRVEGDLTLVGATHPLTLDLDVGDDGRITGGGVITQSAWGIKPYSALFGALKVADDVRVEIDARVPAA